MKSHHEYLSNLIELLTILREDCQQVEEAAGLIAQSLQNDGLIHVLAQGILICWQRRCFTEQAALVP